MDLVLQDNRSSAASQPAPLAAAQFRPDGRGFWADLRRLEQAFGVSLAWQGEVKGQYILVVGDGDLGIDLGQVSGRWRVVVSRGPLGVYWPRSSNWPEDRRRVTLQYLPGPTVIAARWTPPQELVGAEMALGAPSSTAADLGTIPAKMVSRFGGQMEIVTAKAWKEVSIPLKTDAKVTPGAKSGIEQIRVLRYGATDFDLEPEGYHILPAGTEGAKGYVVELGLTSPYEVYLNYEQFTLIGQDGKSQRAELSGIARKNTSGRTRFQPGDERILHVGFMSPLAVEAPASLTVRVPSEVKVQTVEIGKMKELYGPSDQDHR